MKLRNLPTDQRHVCMLAGMAALTGMIVGFAVPLAAQHQPKRFSTQHTLVIPDLESQDAELNRLKIRNRRLEALLATMRQRTQ